MLRITVPAREIFNERDSSFLYTTETELDLEHSLASVSEWESKWHKPFLSQESLSPEEFRDYVRCMTLKNADPLLFMSLSPENLAAIHAYINDPMTATWFSGDQKKTKRQNAVTAEVIYYWMTVLNIPFSCDAWHLNKLMTLIRVCSEKSQKPKKMGKREYASYQTALNEARRKKYRTKG